MRDRSVKPEKTMLIILYSAEETIVGKSSDAYGPSNSLLYMMKLRGPTN